MKTISLKGKEYAPVSERVAQFHKDHPDGSIKTSYKFEDGLCIFKTTITFGDRSFTGHAFGKVGVEKSFEKLESVSCGRALAFSGYLAGGEIASYEEIEKFNEQ